jgi:hypothetical protein
MDPDIRPEVVREIMDEQLDGPEGVAPSNESASEALKRFARDREREALWWDGRVTDA